MFAYKNLFFLNFIEIMCGKLVPAPVWILCGTLRKFEKGRWGSESLPCFLSPLPSLFSPRVPKCLVEKHTLISGEVRFTVFMRALDHAPAEKSFLAPFACRESRRWLEPQAVASCCVLSGVIEIFLIKISRLVKENFKFNL